MIICILYDLKFVTCWSLIVPNASKPISQCRHRELYVTMVDSFKWNYLYSSKHTWVLNNNSSFTLACPLQRLQGEWKNKTTSPFTVKPLWVWPFLGQVFEKEVGLTTSLVLLIWIPLHSGTLHTLFPICKKMSNWIGGEVIIKSLAMNLVCSYLGYSNIEKEEISTINTAKISTYVKTTFSLHVGVCL